jgi:hypothetical protein
MIKIYNLFFFISISFFLQAKNISMTYNNDLLLTSSTTPSYVMLSHAPIYVSGRVTNNGSDTITFYTMNYRINGGQINSSMINTFRMAPTGEYSFTHPIAWQPVDTGIYNVDVWTSNPNGGSDEDTTNDHLLFSIHVLDTFVIRNTCIEMFTGAWCGPCHFVNPQFNNDVLPHLQNYTLVKYHIGPDVFATWEARNRAGFYNSSFVPDFYFDGHRDNDFQTAFSKYQSLPSFISIDISSAFYVDTVVHISGTITPLVDFDTGTFNYQVVITEKENSLYHYGSDSVYDNIQIRMSPNEFGNSISELRKGVPIYFNEVVPIIRSKVQNMGDLKVIVLVQNINDKNVEQSAWRNISFSDDIDEISNAKDILIFPNPVNDWLSVKLNSIHSDRSCKIIIADVSGRQLHFNFEESFFQFQKDIDVSKFAPGIYFIIVKSDDDYLIRKFVKD